MGHVIAVSGKGGVGKTTLCGLLIQYLCESGKRPVLAVDADANANLNEVLGVEPEVTLGELREEIERAGIDPRYQIPSGMTKQAYLEMRLSDAIAEEDDYDLMVMGRTPHNPNFFTISPSALLTGESFGSCMIGFPSQSY